MVSKPPILSLEVQALRGATQPFSLAFDKGKSLTLVYGENGTGKTTICDAFDFIGNGRVGSLDGRGLGSTTVYWAAIGKSKNDVLVTLETTAGKWAASMASKGSAVKIQPDNGSLPQVSVLRRSQLLQLLQNTPANRYEAIRPFIDISAIEASESQLRRLINEIDQQLTTASAIINENKAAIEDEWLAAGKHGADALNWARAEGRKDTTVLAGGTAKLRDLLKALEDLEAGAARLSQAQTRVQDSEQAATADSEALAQAKTACLTDEAATIEILLAAKQYLQEHEHIDACPLCESREFAGDLSNKVASKLNALNELQRAMASSEATGSRLKQSLAVLESEKSALAGLIAKLQTVWETGQEVLQDQVAVKEAIAPIVVSAAASGANTTWEVTVLENARDHLQRAIETMDTARTRTASLKLAVERYETNYANLADISRVLPLLKQALTVMEEERRAFVDRLLHTIAQEVGRLYENLHPGEGLNKISLTLDPAKRSSLELGAEFLAVKDAPPHAYFSESHLDSLGLCIFLALAGLKGRERTILVLDDILGSIDEPHVDRLINLLYDESQKFLHCVITTHYRPWKEKFRWGLLRHGQCQFVELRPWSQQQGVVHGKTSLTPVAELGQLLAADPLSPQLLCGSAGVVLEGMCDYLTTHYECAVPRRKGKPTLGDLLPAIDKKLKPVLKVDRKQDDGSYLPVELGTLFDKMQSMAQVRNIFGAHFNELAMHLPDQDAIEFASLVFTAADALCCAEEGWPMTEKAGSYWATRTETRRLHPFKKPS